MQKNIKQLNRIMDVLRLKRQLAEKAVIDLQLQDRALAARLEALNAPGPAAPYAEVDSISYALAMPPWQLWRDRQKTELNKKRAALTPQMNSAQSALRILIVQLDNVETRYQALRKIKAKDFQAGQAEAGQEIWQATQNRR